MAQKASRETIIRKMIKIAYNIDEPHDWQVEIIYQLCYQRSTSLCIQATGGGKSLLVLGAMALLRLVAIVIEPLKGIGTDQASSARASCPKGMHAFDVDGLPEEDSARVIEVLEQLTADSNSAVILYMSPQSLSEGRPWSGVISRLFSKSLVNLVAFDEADSVPEDGFVFRKEFALLKQNLVQKALDSPKQVPMLAMTATLTVKLKEEFEEMMRVKFLPSCILWGNTSRVDDLRMTLYVGNKVADSIKTKAKRHLEEDDRKVVFGANQKKRVKSKQGLTTGMNQYFQSKSPDNPREAVAYHGDLGGIVRRYYVHSLSSPEPSEHLNLALLNTTSAGFRGLNAKGVGLTAFDGFPMSLVDLAQFMGRVRSAAPEGRLDHEFFLAVSANSLANAIVQIHLDGHKGNRQRRLAALWEVLELVAVPRTCVHGALKMHFSKDGKDDDSTCEWCWYCARCSNGKCKKCYDCWSRPAKDEIIAAISAAVNGAKASAMDLVKALSKKECPMKLTANQAHRPFPQLAAQKLLQYEVIDSSKEGDKEKDLSVVWCWNVVRGRCVHTGRDSRSYWHQILGEQ